VVRLQAELESFKALAIQGCGDGSLTSNPQKENCERLAPYIQDGQLFYQPTMANNSSVKSERQLYFANDCFTSTSTQHSEGYEPDICMPDYYNNSNPSWTTQGSGYHDIDELQSVAFAYLDNAWQNEEFDSYCTSLNSFGNNTLQMSIKFSSMGIELLKKLCVDVLITKTANCTFVV
jgi:hypothetical protein